MDRPWFIGPNDALDDPELSDPAFRVLCFVWRACWSDEAPVWSKPIQIGHLADLLNISRSTLWRLIRDLVGRSYIEMEHVGGRGGGAVRLRPSMSRKRDIENPQSEDRGLSMSRKRDEHGLETLPATSRDRDKLTPQMAFDRLSMSRDRDASGADEPEPSRKRDIVPPSSSSYIPTTSNRDSELEAEEEEEERPESVANLEHFGEIDKLLAGAGVGASMRGRLVRMDHVNLRYVMLHLARVKKYNEPLRYALHRMLEAERPGICPACQCTLDSPEHTSVLDISADEIIRCPLRETDDPDTKDPEQIDAAITAYFGQPSHLSEFRPLGRYGEST